LREAASLSGLPRLHDVRRVSGKLTVVSHPLVQHKLSYLRDQETPTVHFRKLANEVTLLLTYEATKDLPTEPVEVETPLERMVAERISGKKVAVCPVLRAGMGMLDGVLSLVSGARVGFIGLYRDEETLEPVQYYVKLPSDLDQRDVIVLDPMLATGNSSAAAVSLVKEGGARSVSSTRPEAGASTAVRSHGSAALPSSLGSSCRRSPFCISAASPAACCWARPWRRRSGRSTTFAASSGGRSSPDSSLRPGSPPGSESGSTGSRFPSWACTRCRPGSGSG